MDDFKPLFEYVEKHIENKMIFTILGNSFEEITEKGD